MNDEPALHHTCNCVGFRRLQSLPWLRYSWDVSLFFAQCKCHPTFTNVTTVLVSFESVPHRLSARWGAMSTPDSILVLQAPAKSHSRFEESRNISVSSECPEGNTEPATILDRGHLDGTTSVQTSQGPRTSTRHERHMAVIGFDTEKSARSLRTGITFGSGMTIDIEFC